MQVCHHGVKGQGFLTTNLFILHHMIVNLIIAYLLIWKLVGEKLPHNYAIRVDITAPAYRLLG